MRSYLHQNNEDDYTSVVTRSYFLPFLQSVQKRLNEYKEKLNNEIDVGEKIVLDHANALLEDDERILDLTDDRKFNIIHTPTPEYAEYLEETERFFVGWLYFFGLKKIEIPTKPLHTITEVEIEAHSQKILSTCKDTINWFIMTYKWSPHDMRNRGRRYNHPEMINFLLSVEIEGHIAKYGPAADAKELAKKLDELVFETSVIESSSITISQKVSVLIADVERLLDKET